MTNSLQNTCLKWRLVELMADGVLRFNMHCNMSCNAWCNVWFHCDTGFLACIHLQMAFDSLCILHILSSFPGILTTALARMLFLLAPTGALYMMMCQSRNSIQLMQLNIAMFFVLFFHVYVKKRGWGAILPQFFFH